LFYKSDFSKMFRKKEASGTGENVPRRYGGKAGIVGMAI
jgi:hypothetical protein